jgi:hypothetical protein
MIFSFRFGLYTGVFFPRPVSHIELPNHLPEHLHNLFLVPICELERLTVGERPVDQEMEQLMGNQTGSDAGEVYGSKQPTPGVSWVSGLVVCPALILIHELTRVVSDMDFKPLFSFVEVDAERRFYFLPFRCGGFRTHNRNKPPNIPRTSRMTKRL